MTDKVDTLVWFYNYKGQVRSIRLGNFLNRINKRKHIFGGQDYFATKKLAIKNNWIARSK